MINKHNLKVIINVIHLIIVMLAILLSIYIMFVLLYTIENQDSIHNQVQDEVIEGNYETKI